MKAMTIHKKNKKLDTIVRIKKRILKESCNLDTSYKTTYKDIKKYFKIFNKALFKDQLNPFNDIQIKRMNGLLGSVYSEDSLRKGTRPCFAA